MKNEKKTTGKKEFESMAGSLGKKYGKISLKEILKDLQEDRRNSDRF